ncbi:hypothetical protein ACFWOX_40755, partial [Streptomyces sp. NPDC058467]|uniref:hypothetical protein n=1 Tax=Streptomyces sp. NPDC058467 TaxID=3346513 RepID=UPI00365BB108
MVGELTSPLRPLSPMSLAGDAYGAAVKSFYAAGLLLVLAAFYVILMRISGRLAPSSSTGERPLAHLHHRMG